MPKFDKIKGLKIHDLNRMQVPKFWLSREVILGFALTLFIIVPVVVFGGNDDIYVDEEFDGTPTGSELHPYRTISEALKHADEGTSVHIAKGKYNENITIPKDVKLFGRKADKGDVIIRSDNDDKPTVTMRHESELNYLTIEEGRHGVRIEEDAEAKLYKVVIKGSDRDGVHIDSAPRDAKHRALLDSVEIEGSKRAGVYSERRDLVVVNSDIHNNASDGIDLAAGMKAWFEHNRINSNGGSGIKAVLDGASVWTKSNSIRSNVREGVEVNAYGGAGNVGLKKADLIGNGRYGVARVARTANAWNTFGGIIYGTDVNANRIETNRIGGISPVIRGF